MRTLSSPYGPIEVIACGDPALLETLEMDATLDVFRPPAEQFKALLEIARDIAGCVCFSKLGHRLIGYATFHPPDPIERWSQGRVPGIIELGAIETSRTHRGRHLARHLLEEAVQTGRFEDKILIATIYQWHFDLEGTNLTAHAYRKLLERMYGAVDFSVVKTDDPEIVYYPGNSLMARVGKDAPPALIAEFDRLRFLETGRVR